jgi:hypothetical protein
VSITRLLYAFLAAFLIASPCRAAIEIPFTFNGGMIWLKVNVAGQSSPLNFLLDSGAGRSVLDLGAAQHLRLKLGARQTVQGVQGQCAAYPVDDFAATVSGVPVPRNVLALDLSSVASGIRSRIDGLLGADFFRSHIVQIDFAAQKVRLLSRDQFRSDGPQVIPLVRRNDALCIRVGVNGNAPQWMRLDTGCSGALEWIVTGGNTRRTARTSIATSSASRKYLQTEVLLGNERLSAVKTGVHSQPFFAGEAGLVGNGLLSRFCVTVDADKSQLLLRRAAK